MPILSWDADQKSLETGFSNAICRHTGDKWKSKTLFLSIFYLVCRLLIAFSIVAYPVCDFFKIKFSKKFFEEYHHGAKQLTSSASSSFK